MSPALGISWSLMSCLVSRLLAPEGKLQPPKRGEEFMPQGSMLWRRVATMLGNHIYVEKNGLSTAVGQIPRWAHLFVQRPLASDSVPRGHMMALPLFNCQEWDKKDREEETNLAALSVSVSGLSLPCQRINCIFKCSGSS